MEKQISGKSRHRSRGYVEGIDIGAEDMVERIDIGADGDLI